MLYSWYILTRETSRHRRRPEHPLDDPLDRPEWRGFAWIFLLAARLKEARPPQEKDRSAASAGRRAAAGVTSP